MRIIQQRRRRQVPIVYHRKPPVPGSNGRVPSLSEARSDEVRIGVPPHRSGHGIRGGGGSKRDRVGICFAMLPLPCLTRCTRPSPSPLPREGRDVIVMGGGAAAAGGSRRMRRRLFRALLYAARGPGPPPKTKDDTAPCRGCILPARDPSTSGVEAVPGTSSETTMSAGGGGGGDARESERSLLSFSGS